MLHTYRACVTLTFRRENLKSAPSNDSTAGHHDCVNYADCDCTTQEELMNGFTVTLRIIIHSMIIWSDFKTTSTKITVCCHFFQPLVVINWTLQSFQPLVVINWTLQSPVAHHY